MTFADLQSISLEFQKFSKINWHVSESTSTTFLSSLRSHIWSSRLKYITGCSITFSLSEPQCYPHISTPLCRRKLSKVRTEWVCLFLLPLPHLLHAIDIPLPWFSFLVFSFLPEMAKMKHTIFFLFFLVCPSWFHDLTFLTSSLQVQAFLLYRSFVISPSFHFLYMFLILNASEFLRIAAKVSLNVSQLSC